MGRGIFTRLVASRARPSETLLRLKGRYSCGAGGRRRCAKPRHNSVASTDANSGLRRILKRHRPQSNQATDTPTTLALDPTLTFSNLKSLADIRLRQNFLDVLRPRNSAEARPLDRFESC